MIRLALTALAASLLLAAAGCGGKSASPAKLTSLRDVGQLRSAFNARAGQPRLIVLLSPT